MVDVVGYEAGVSQLHGFNSCSQLLIDYVPRLAWPDKAFSGRSRYMDYASRQCGYIGQTQVWVFTSSEINAFFYQSLDVSNNIHLNEN